MTQVPVASSVQVRDVDASFRRKGVGEPLVYFHGMGLTRRWLELYELLADQFDVVVPDHPGFGDTFRPRWYRTLDDIVLHYADFLSAIGLADAHVVGHSLGGKIAGSFAAIFPERVRSLTLIAPSPLAMIRARPPREQLVPEGGFDALLFNDQQERFPEYRDGDDAGQLVAPADADPHADPSAWSIDGADTLYRRLARLRCRAQLLVPDEDRILPSVFFDDWARWLDGAPVIRIPGSVGPTGHLLIVQEPRLVAQRVADFCSAIH